MNTDTVKEIPFDKYEHNFSIIVNGQTYQTNRFVVDLLSPRIRQYHFNDSSIDCFYIDTNDIQSQEKEDQYMRDLFSISNLENIKIEGEEINFVLHVFYALGNFELVKQLLPEIINTKNDDDDNNR